MTRQKDNILDHLSDWTPEKLLHELHDVIWERLRLLDGVFKLQFVGDVIDPTSQWSRITLNRFLLRESVESSLCDMYRLKFFREIFDEDSHKTAAFLVTWILRIRPVQFIQGMIPHLKQELFVNEFFAAFVAFSVLDIRPKDVYDKMPSYFANMIYLWHFHPTQPERLASEFFLLERQIKDSVKTKRQSL